jgi:hypothetical protein
MISIWTVKFHSEVPDEVERYPGGAVVVDTMHMAREEDLDPIRIHDLASTFPKTGRTSK